jgi:TolA-binding protein
VPAPPPPSAAPGVPGPSVSASPGESAPALFARANAARRAGATEEALRTYRELAQRFPASREALTSRVAVGRLLLERTGDPAWALREFDAYLTASPRGTLAEDALAGRALCLQRLGNSGAEQEAWRELLRRFPSTVHRARAEQRLSAGAN